MDCGPGVVRRAAAAHAAGVPGLAPHRLSRLLLTHLHSDHTAGLPDLALTPWTLGRTGPLRVYGPPGTRHMAGHVQAAWEEDVRARLEGDEPAVDGGWRMVAQEVEPGFSLAEDGASVEAFEVRHGAMEALGWRVCCPGGTVVISGDTAPFPGMERSYEGADILLHEAFSEAGLSRRGKNWRRYHSGAHMPARELGAVAAKVRPGLLVMTHVLGHGAGEAAVLDEVRQGGWMGPAVLGSDLDVFEVPPGSPRG